MHYVLSFLSNSNKKRSVFYNLIRFELPSGNFNEPLSELWLIFFLVCVWELSFCVNDKLWETFFRKLCASQRDKHDEGGKGTFICPKRHFWMTSHLAYGNSYKKYLSLLTSLLVKNTLLELEWRYVHFQK